MSFSSPESLDALCLRYDAFIIDLWGVLHDGTALYDGALETLHALKARHKRITLLSNAPRKTDKVVQTLERLGITSACYDALITSGQAAHDMLARSNQWGLHYYYLGPSKDEDVIADLPYEKTTNPALAAFVLNAGFEEDFQETGAILPTLDRLLKAQLPLICINPDLEVVKQDGTRMWCAGWVARHYEQMGGNVTYIGKPYPLVYDEAFAASGVAPSRSLAIGDNLLTDILGANHAGIDSLLVTGGILKSEHGTIPDDTALHFLCDEAGAHPTYTAPSLGSLIAA